MPIEAFEPSWLAGNLDENGWTLQSDSIDVNEATVTITQDDGVSLPVTTNGLAAGYGSSYAIRWFANGRRTEAGHTYHVELTGVPTPISYDVRVLSCP